ncbi:unnamed protein product, partial [Mesorhabditis spiculigera]
MQLLALGPILLGLAAAQQYKPCTVGSERISSNVFVYKCVQGNPRLGTLEIFAGCRYENQNAKQATAAVGEAVRVNTQPTLNGWIKGCATDNGINSFNVIGCYVYMFDGKITDIKTGSWAVITDPFFGQAKVNATCGVEANGYTITYVPLQKTPPRLASTVKA